MSYYEMCVRMLERAYAVAALYALGYVDEALTLFSMCVVPGFV
jgi:hypothetical protein